MKPRRVHFCSLLTFLFLLSACGSDGGNQNPNPSDGDESSDGDSLVDDDDDESDGDADGDTEQMEKEEEDEYEEEENCRSDCPIRDDCSSFLREYCPDRDTTDHSDICLNGILHTCKTSPYSTCCEGLEIQYIPIEACLETTMGCQDAVDAIPTWFNLPTEQQVCYITENLYNHPAEDYEMECPGEAGSDTCGNTPGCGQDAQYPDPAYDPNREFEVLGSVVRRYEAIGLDSGYVPQRGKTRCSSHNASQHHANVSAFQRHFQPDGVHGTSLCRSYVEPFDSSLEESPDTYRFSRIGQ